MTSHKPPVLGSLKARTDNIVRKMQQLKAERANEEGTGTREIQT